MAAHAFLREGQQGFRHQLRAEEGATDTDVDDVGDRLFAVAAPHAAVDAADQLGHLIEHAVHFRHHVDAVDRQALADRPAQGGVQGWATFRAVYQLAVEQGANGLLQAALAGQVDQQGAGLTADQVLRVIEEQAAAGHREFAEAQRVLGKGLAQGEIVHGIAMLTERPPGRQGRGVEGVLVIRHVAASLNCVQPLSMKKPGRFRACSLACGRVRRPARESHCWCGSVGCPAPYTACAARSWPARLRCNGRRHR